MEDNKLTHIATSKSRWLFAERGPISGRVSKFDYESGLGEISLAVKQLDETTSCVDVFFHCISIEDGTRDIEVSAPVEVLIGPGQIEAYEAISVKKI
ncbi:MAG: hypothetical protein HKL80_05880 [Acidimicrobiales bacterium]|nr:hypothetical protein [Acidimicrobiales bacterium]